MTKRILQIGKWGSYWVIKGIYNNCLDNNKEVEWRFVEVSYKELAAISRYHLDDWLKKLWARDLIKQELETRQEVKAALQDLFTLLH